MLLLTALSASDITFGQIYEGMLNGVFFTCSVCSALVAVYTAVLFTMLRTQLSVLITGLTQCGLVLYTWSIKSGSELMSVTSADLNRFG